MQTKHVYNAVLLIQHKYTKTKKINDNKMKEKSKTTAKKPKKVVRQNTIKNNKTEATGNTNKTGTTVKRVKQERQE